MTKTDEILHPRHVHRRAPSPVGVLTLVASEDGLAAILWEGDSPRRVPIELGEERPDHPVLVDAQRQLDEYFAGRRRQFALRMDAPGTAFQREVWSALLTIPFGETRSYAQVAQQIGRPGAARAVGAAIGRNPLSIVTPCHRVVGAAGALTGFAGGLDVKARLLAFERGGRRAASPLTPPGAGWSGGAARPRTRGPAGP